ncbi:MAG: polysaccharide export protein EpsE [Candidatus Nitricoxidivorans perseverans]|uniref:Polysaccharide export protein EpsE n=1 Tax=Candidatus Nitricoxidivorans perseverans TaxID=2975601 RepID=A0AA49FLV8_9PROT|nr:MAG: polysaccharide export protein EpsE [Candidatus Nitricoxidivorans perseverans]
MPRQFLRLLFALMVMVGGPARAADATPDYTLSAGDVIKISVFQNPDLTLETRVSESGSISYPLIGEVNVGGRSVAESEKAIAKGLSDGGFIKQPHVTITLLQLRGNQVSVLGLVNRAGRYPLETANMRLSEAIAVAGGVSATGADIAILIGTRNGKPYRVEVDIPSIYLDAKPGADIQVAGGDSIYVHRAPMFYIYGEVQRPGAYRLERGMTVMQGLAQGGGPTLRGSEGSLRVMRRAANGAVESLEPANSDALRTDDVIYVPESLF